LLMQPLTVAEAAEIGLGETHREMRGFAIVAPAEHFAMGIDPGQGASVAERHVKPHGAETGVEPAIDQLQQPVAPLPRYGGQSHRVSIAPLDLVRERGARRWLQQIDLVHDLDEPLLDQGLEAEVAEYRQYIGLL